MEFVVVVLGFNFLLFYSFFFFLFLNQIESWDLTSKLNHKVLHDDIAPHMNLLGWDVWIIKHLEDL